MRKTGFLVLILCFGLLSLAEVLNAQSAPPIGETAPGTPLFGSFGGGPFDVLNLATLNAHFEIPVINKPGRGGPFVFNLTYDSSAWYYASVSSVNTWQPVANYGWNSFLPTYAFGYFSSKIVSSYTQPCDPSHGNFTPVAIQIYSMFAYYDTKGTPHPFPGSTSNYTGGCAISAPPMTLTGLLSSDGSGYFVNISEQTASNLHLKLGGVINTNATASSTVDANGNVTSANNGVYTDTLGTNVLTITGTNPVLLSYTAPNGSTQKYTVNYTATNVKTNFGCSGIAEYSASSVPLITSIVLPDSSQYSFTYEATQGGPSGSTTGRLASVTLPTGGSITYTYPTITDSHGVVHNGINCTDGSAPPVNGTNPSLSMTRVVSSPGGTWQYARSNMPSTAQWTTTITSPPDPVNSGASDVTVINFSKDLNGGIVNSSFYETQRQVYQGATTGTLLVTTYNCWNNNFTTCATQNVSSPITQLDSYTLLASGTKNQVETVYNGYGLPTDQKSYDWGTTSLPLLQETVTTYASLTNGIVDHPASVTVKDGSGNVKAKTLYFYDGGTLHTTSGTPQNLGVSSGSRGNLTTVDNYTNASTFLTKSFSYYDTGNVYQATDFNGGVTTYTYGTGSCGNSFPTSVTMPLSLSTSAAYDSSCAGGVVTSSTDVNGNVTATSYTDPYFWRPASVSYPDGGQTTYTYTSQTQTSTQAKLDSTPRWVDTTTILDGFGNVSKQQRTNDPLGVIEVDAQYDAFGRVSQVSNPYIVGTSSPTDGNTQFTYDALGRKTKITNPDSSYQSLTYTNRATEIQDEGNGTSRITKVYQNDGLGRLASVCEVTSVSQMSVSPIACGQDITATGFLTNYTYDALGNLLTVAQSGLNNRTYTYDFLSRLTSESNPETNNGSTINTISYSYDSCSAGDLCSRVAPKPNQTGSATVTTSYSYDALHRLTGKTYNDGITSNVAYAYDQTAPWGWTITNPKGNLTLHTTATQTGTNLTQQMFEYDSMGRPTETGECTPMNCAGVGYHCHYTYNALGELVTESDDVSTVTYTTSYDGAARFSKLQSNLVNSTHPGTLFTVNAYNPLGEVNQATFGYGVVRNATYDSRGRLLTQTDGSIYSFSLGLAPNSNLLTGNDTVNGNWTYTYDDFNRSSTSSKTGQAFQYLYDRFGNRWHQNVTAGSGPAPSYSFDSNNHTSSFSYDAAGNLTNDGFHTYTYDAEGRVMTVDGGSTASYIYNAVGQRVEATISGTTSDYMFDQGTEPVTRIIGGNWVSSEIYAGLHIATYYSGTTYFDHTDWLGTTRALSDPSGTGVGTCTGLAYGDLLNCSGSSLISHFTDQPHDFESGLEHFMFRQYNSTQGRWMTPDPAGMAAADPTNPQSWNRYAYVMNSPLNYVDPFGLEAQCSGGSCTSSVYTCPSGQTFQNGVCVAGQCQGAQGTSTINGTTICGAYQQYILDLIYRALAAANGLSGFTSNYSLPGMSNSTTTASKKSKYAECFQSCVNTMFSSNSHTFVDQLKNSPKNGLKVGLGACTVVTMSEPYLLPTYPGCVAATTVSTTTTFAGLALTEFLIYQPTSVFGCAAFCPK